MAHRGGEEEQRISETWNVEKKGRAANAWLSSCRLGTQITVVFTFMICSVYSSLFFSFFPPILISFFIFKCPLWQMHIETVLCLPPWCQGALYLVGHSWGGCVELCVHFRECSRNLAGKLRE